MPDIKFSLQPSFQEKQYRLEAIMPLFKEKLAAGNSVIFFPKGTSMMPMIRQGVDKVVLSPLPKKLKKYDLPLYQRDNGQFVLHRIVKADNTYTCIGDNQFQFETGLTHDQMIGVVTAFSRGKREWKVTHPLYRLYCRFWHISRPLRHLWRRGIGWLRRHLA